MNLMHLWFSYTKIKDPTAVTSLVFHAWDVGMWYDEI